MWPFKSTKTLEKAEIFKGFTDWHSHILPGVDDGIPNMDSALEALNSYEQHGVSRIWLTPHIMEDIPNTTDELKTRFDQLKNAYNGKIELHLAAENMLDNLFETRLRNNDVLPIGHDGNHLLVETSYLNPPMGLYEIISSIFSAGYFPILAHPERYVYMDKNMYKLLHERGVVFQMNLISIVGGFGETARKKAEWLLDNNMISMLGTDIHRLKNTMGWFQHAPKKAKHIEILSDLAKNPLQI